MSLLIAGMPLQSFEKLDSVVESILRQARVPGAGLAVVAAGKALYAKGFGYRDLKRRKPLTADTLYPIASTTKSINSTLLGMLVDDGLLEWDVPVQRYVPQFRLYDDIFSSRVTLRDLLTMRTGLPRHDWVALGNCATRPQILERLKDLEPSADFRQRFQYNNLTVTAAGHIAEIVTGKRWEDLAQQRIFRPLDMSHTTCVRPLKGNFTLSYHENAHRRLIVSTLSTAEYTAPSGGAVYSTVRDMARWISLNLNHGKLGRRQLIDAKTLAEIHAPQVVVGTRPLAALPRDAAYALGWLVDTYNGHQRIFHGGYLHDIASCVMLFPEVGIGLVSFANFGPVGVGELLGLHAFDALMGLEPKQTLSDKLAAYEKAIVDTRARNASLLPVPNTLPSRGLNAYCGTYEHPGYGRLDIRRHGSRGLILHRGNVEVPLRHWHYDTWVSKESDRWVIHLPRPLDATSPAQFLPGPSGDIQSVAIAFEPEVAPIQFLKVPRSRR